jgi:tetratricopeptide (TPR) repeat protein/MFS family permease
VSRQAASVRRLPLRTIVFLASAAIMTMELAAGRLIAPHLGMSLYTWTGIIGAVMAGMALGNAAGGRIADRTGGPRLLGWALLSSGAGMAALIPLNSLLGLSPLAAIASWPERILLHTALLFAPPALLLGAITPIAARLAMREAQTAGRTAGAIFAAAVAGSIAGTFATGYVLVMVFSVTQILLGTAGLLALLGAGVLAMGRMHGLQGVAAEAPPLGDAMGTTQAGKRRLWLAVNATVVASNAAFMCFELSAARVLSREFGGSLYTWTTVIGVFLAGITLGNWLGGRIADRRPDRRSLSMAFFLASLGTLAALPLARIMSVALNHMETLYLLPWPVQIAIFSAVCFFLPNIALGAISPIGVKLAVNAGAGAGRAVGAIYAWGSAGSILATFAAGYFLIAWMGSLTLIAAVACLLALCALAWAPRGTLAAAWAGVCVLGLLGAWLPLPGAEGAGRLLGLRLPPDETRLFETESQYGYIAVHAVGGNPRVRSLLLDKLVHTQVDLDRPDSLEYEYEWIYDAIVRKRHGNTAPIRGFVIGGGGYAFPHYLALTRPGSHIEVAEIDPEVTECAHAWFGLPRDTPIRIYNQDARNRVADLARAGTRACFDYVFGDSINDYTVPYHLTTFEFALEIERLLTDDGVYLLNMIDVFESGAFLAAVIETNRRVFPFVYVFNTGRPPNMRDTFVVVSAKQPLNLTDTASRIREKYAYAGALLPQETVEALLARHRGLVLTDNFAPVENFLLPAVNTRRKDPATARLERARARAAAGDVAGALQECAAALAIRPGDPELLDLQGELYLLQGDADHAIAALQEAARHSPTPEPLERRIGEVMLEHGRGAEGAAVLEALLARRPADAATWQRLGVHYLGTGNADRAAHCFEQAATYDARSVTARYNLGLAHVAQRRFDAAIAAWESVLAIDPGHVDSLHNLALACTLSGKYDRAWEAVRQLRALGVEPGAELIATLRQQSGRSE